MAYTTNVLDYTEDTLEFDKVLLNALKQAQLEMAQSGGVKRVKKGDFQAEYRSMQEIEAQIKSLARSIYIRESGCVERKLCQ